MHLLKTIETERLILKTPTWADAPDIFRYACKPEVAKFLSWHAHETLDDSYRFIALVEKRMQEGVLEEFGIFPKDNDHIIGTIGLMPKANYSKAAVGYVIDKPYWGRGYVSEALNALIDYAFSMEKMYRIEAICDETNIGSRRVMEKCGMEREGLLRSYIYDERHENPHRNVFMYSILKPRHK